MVRLNVGRNELIVLPVEEQHGLSAKVTDN